MSAILSDAEFERGHGMVGAYLPRTAGLVRATHNQLLASHAALTAKLAECEAERIALQGEAIRAYEQVEQVVRSKTEPLEAQLAAANARVGALEDALRRVLNVGDGNYSRSIARRALTAPAEQAQPKETP